MKIAFDFGHFILRAAFVASCVFLASCGGGGSGAAPDLTTPQQEQISDAEAAQARGLISAEVNEYRAAAESPRTNLDDSQRLTILLALDKIQEQLDRRIAVEIHAAQQALEALQAVLASLSVSTTPSCGANERDSGTGDCVCAPGYDRDSRGVCSIPLVSSPSCAANKARDEDGNCICIAGYEPDGNGSCVLPSSQTVTVAAVCPAGQILNAERNACVTTTPEPPPIQTTTEADCSAGQIFDAAANVCRVAQTNAECALLDGETPIFDAAANGNCRARVCPVNETSNQEGVCVCIGGDVRDLVTGVCPPPRPQPAACGANEERFFRYDDCVCQVGFVRDDNGVCTATNPGAEIRSSIPLCTYTSPDPDNEKEQICQDHITEYYNSGDGIDKMGALYAYQKGYNGQGVTVAFLSQTRTDHEELDANVITTDIDYGYVGTRFSNSNSVTITGAFERRIIITATVNGRIFTRATIVALQSVTVRNDHLGTRYAAMIVGERNGRGAHGVAPEAKLIPVPPSYPLASTRCRSYSSSACAEEIKLAALRWLYNNRADIGIVAGGVFEDATSEVSDAEQAVYQRMKDSDLVFVWGVGSYWRYGGDEAATITAFATGGESQNWRYRGKRIHSVPELIPDMTDNWLLARTTLGVGCGVTREFCLSAPADGQKSQPEFFGGKDENRLISGLPYDDSREAAAYISGALALLKSAAPELPMTVVRQVLLDTATDLTPDDGQRVDDEYGWGLVNISAGIVSITNIQTADGLALRSLRGSLPGELSHLRGRLSEVSVALRITDNSYYNMPLSAVLPEGDSSGGTSGAAARKLMAAEYAAGESFRFWGGLDYDGNRASRFISDGGGVFGAAESADAGGYLRWTTAKYGGFSLFGEYEYADISAEYGGNSWIQSVRGAHAEGWTTGMQFADVWKFGDRLRFSATDEMSLSGGDMVLRYPVAIGGASQTIRMQETRIPLDRRRTMIYAVGYGREYDGGDWTAAAEYNSRTGAAAFSAQLRVEF